MWRPIHMFRADERGATSIEYGMIMGIIGLSLVVVLTALPGILNAFWASAAAHLN